MAKKQNYPIIPAHTKVTSKRTYETLYTDDFKDGKTMGEARFDPPQIVIQKGHNEKETFSTYIHELIHSIAFENDINLTEDHVLKLEKGILRVLVLNKWI